jgi:hypothetical protein
MKLSILMVVNTVIAGVFGIALGFGYFTFSK